MPRAFLALFCLLASLAHAAPNSILHRPYDLDTGHGVLRGSLLLPRSACRRRWSCWSPAPVPPIATATTPSAATTATCCASPRPWPNAESPACATTSGSRPQPGGGAARGRPQRRRLCRRRGRLERAAGPRPALLRLILVGHSEGALIASLAAPRTPAEELIAIAGSGQPIDRVLREQLRGRLPPAQLRQADSVLASLKAGETRSDIPPALSSLLRPSVQPYLISLFREDPARAFGRLRIPTLIVQGRNDIQVGVADAKALQRAKPDSQLVLIDGMNHILPDRPEHRSPAAFRLQRPEPAAGPATGRGGQPLHPARRRRGKRPLSRYRNLFPRRQVLKAGP